MANVYLQDSTLTAIGNAIRTKGGTTAQLLPSEMPAAITNLPSGGSFDKIIDLPTLCYSTSAGKGKRTNYTPTANGDVLSYSVLGFTDLEDFINNGTAMYWIGILPQMKGQTAPSGSGVTCTMALFPTLAHTVDIDRLKKIIDGSKYVLPVATGWGNGVSTVATVGGWQTKNASSTATVTGYGIGTFAFLTDSGITVKCCNGSTGWGTGSPAYASQFPKGETIITLKRA